MSPRFAPASAAIARICFSREELGDRGLHVFHRQRVERALAAELHRDEALGAVLLDEGRERVDLLAAQLSAAGDAKPADGAAAREHVLERPGSSVRASTSVEVASSRP